MPKAAQNRKEMRQSVGYNLGTILVSTCTSNGSTSTVVDTSGLAYGGTDDYKGQEIIMVSGTVANIGKTARVSGFSGTTLTFAPIMTSTVSADGYELHETFLVAEINNQLNQAILGASDEILVDKVDDTTLLKLDSEYVYTIPTGFVGLSAVDYEYEAKISHLLSDCDEAWTAGTNATTTADTSFKKVGNASSKSVVVSAGVTEILCYKAITSTDISDCDKVEFWMYSSIALTAGQLTIKLDDSVAIGSALESIDIPAMTAATWYKHSLSLANPHSDTAIISIGIYQVANVADFTFYVDDVHAVLARSRVYRELSPDHWGIVQGSTPLLELDEVAYAKIGNNKRLRLSGYELPAELSGDSTDCDIDPDYIVAKATATLGSRIKDFNVDYWQGIAERKLLQARTSPKMNTRWITW